MGRVAAVLMVVALVAAGGASAVRPPSAAPRVVEIVYGSAAAYRSGVATHRGRIVQAIPALRLLVTRAAGSAIRREHGVVTVQPTAPRASAGSPGLALGLVSTPAGGAYEWQWYATHADRVAPAILAAAAQTTIAVVDTGADLSSPALAGKVAGAYDVRRGKRGASDTTGHGTFVASLAGGTGGVAGFGGAARILIVKVGDGDRINDVDVAAGIVSAVQRGARIVNISISGPSSSPAEESAVAYAARHGALLVAAVGNDALSGNEPQYPAALLQPVGSNGVGGAGLAVGASDATGQRAAFSEHGSFVSLVAPGAAVFGALPRAPRASAYSRTALPGASGGTYAFASGTSYASPQVAGAAALVWAANPRLSAREVAALLERTADGGGSWNADRGYGVLDVAAAVAAALRTV